MYLYTDQSNYQSIHNQIHIHKFIFIERKEREKERDVPQGSRRRRRRREENSWSFHRSGFTAATAAVATAFVQRWRVFARVASLSLLQPLLLLLFRDGEFSPEWLHCRCCSRCYRFATPLVRLSFFPLLTRSERRARELVVSRGLSRATNVQFRSGSSRATSVTTLHHLNHDFRGFIGRESKDKEREGEGDALQDQRGRSSLNEEEESGEGGLLLCFCWRRRRKALDEEEA